MNEQQFAPDDEMSFSEWIESKDGSLHAAYLKACSRLQGSAATTLSNEGNEDAS